MHNGRAVVTSANKHLKSWEQAVAWSAQCAKLSQNGGVMLSAPVSLAVEFRMPAPKKGREGYHAKAPDLDKLVRGICDPLSGVLYEDDRHIARITATKRYVNPGECPGAVIALAVLP